MTMTLLFDDAAADTVRSRQNPVRRAFAAVATAFADWRAARARRIALRR